MLKVLEAAMRLLGTPCNKMGSKHAQFPGIEIQFQHYVFITLIIHLLDCSTSSYQLTVWFKKIPTASSAQCVECYRWRTI